MRRVTALLAAVGAMLLLYASGVLAQEAPGSAGGADRYIVVLNEGVSDPGQTASAMSRRYDLQVGFVYRHALKGFSATIPNGQVTEARADGRVAYLERDGTMRAFAQALPWGIDKIDADTSSTGAGDGSGAIANVNAYVIDTGIDTAHADLSVVGHVNFAGGPNKDCHGHGTHVAGTVAAEDNATDVVGVAPGTPLTGVKVLGCGGTGSTSGVIKGVDWVTANAAKPAIANMSLGGGASKALDDAVRRSAASSVFYSVAAGNDGADACTGSPARAGAGTNNGIATVAATNKSDGETSWSNYGSCVDIWAPGANILSTRKGGGTTTMSGTSMAAPHVGGGGALYLSRNANASSSSVVEDALTSSATPTTNTSKDGATITREYVASF
jgi:subtilisin family serine protease